LSNGSCDVDEDIYICGGDPSQTASAFGTHIVDKQLQYEWCIWQQLHLHTYFWSPQPKYLQLEEDYLGLVIFVGILSRSSIGVYILHIIIGGSFSYRKD